MIVGASGAVYPTNYAMHVFGAGSLGGLWVEKRANLKESVSIGENLTATDDALIVSKGKTTLNGATTIASTGSLTLAGNGAGANKYLMSDATGKGTWTALPATATNAEPWQVQGGTTQATSNTDNIYQAGKVAIGIAQTSGVMDKSLYVKGATLFDGIAQVGTSTASQSLGVHGTATITGNTTIGKAAAGTTPASGNLIVYNKVGIGRQPANGDFALAITGNTNNGGFLTVGDESGTIEAGRKFQVQGGSNVTGNSKVGSSTVVGAQSVGGTLSVVAIPLSVKLPQEPLQLVEIWQYMAF